MPRQWPGHSVQVSLLVVHAFFTVFTSSLALEKAFDPLQVLGVPFEGQSFATYDGVVTMSRDELTSQMSMCEREICASEEGICPHPPPPCCSQKSTLGRAVFCISRVLKPEVTLDTFGGSGTLAILSGWGLEGSSQTKRIHMFEIDEEAFKYWVDTWRCKQFPYQDAVFASFCGAEPMQNVKVSGALINPDQVLSIPWASFCGDSRDVFVIWDPPSASDAVDGYVLQWMAIFRSCQPRLVVVQNTNLPAHGGWLAWDLFGQGWEIVARGHSGLLDKMGEQSIYDTRHWVLLMRPTATHSE